MFLFSIGDACIPNPCQNGGTCVFDEPTGSFQCTCPPGYTGRTCDMGKQLNTTIGFIVDVINYR